MFRFPPKKILVLFDFSDRSVCAWHHARSLSRRFSSALEVIYVEPWFSAIGQWQRQRLDAIERRELIARVRAKIGGACLIHVLEGDPAVIALRTARTHKPDLIVMGVPHHRGPGKFRMSSAADSIVRFSPVPVLVVHEDPKPICSVLAPVHLRQGPQQSFRYAAALAATLKARLTAFHVDADPLYESKPMLAALIHDLSPDVRKICKVRMRFNYGHPAQCIVSQARKHDLVVMGAHHKALLRDMVVQTMVEEVVQHSPVPVLSVPAPKISFRWRESAPAVLSQP